ncbi:MAG: AmmeMemoRadiSam system radical SAM enzyme [Candidatus Omnitrophica bacterium]|nr:AmmeMemoRadiSam system radical SAM enzyme [Candidatus Omnitrophota bacterium]
MIECDLCPHYCKIAEFGRGECGARVNKGDKLYTLVYGKPCAVEIDPIEKKPLYHMLPGVDAFSIATAGCCLHCKYCQNWQISQARPEDTANYDLPPEAVVREALRYNCKTIAYTYTEPTIFYEYMLDTARLARQNGIMNLYITCGYINPEPLREFAAVLDGANVDLKGWTETFYREVSGGNIEPVKRTIKYLYKEGVDTEVTNLIVPTINDNFDEIRAMCRWLRGDVSPHVPLHFSRFSPQYKLRHLPPTPYETLSRARQIALEEGLKYVYIGNVYETEGQNTLCPSCRKILIGRAGFSLLENRIEDGRCGYCGEVIYGIWPKKSGGVVRNTAL